MTQMRDIKQIHVYLLGHAQIAVKNNTSTTATKTSTQKNPPENKLKNDKLCTLDICTLHLIKICIEKQLHQEAMICIFYIQIHYNKRHFPWSKELLTSQLRQDSVSHGRESRTLTTKTISGCHKARMPIPDAHTQNS